MAKDNNEEPEENDDNLFDDDDFGFACIFILLRRHSRMCRMWRLLCWCYSISINGKHGLKGRFSV